MEWERIAAGEVAVGDRVARTRKDVPLKVERIEPGPTSIWLYLAAETCPACEGQGGGDAGVDGDRCPTCWHPWDAGRVKPTQVGGGRIRPRKTANLWRAVA